MTTGRRRPHGAAPGFTLLELLIVMAIIAVGAVVTGLAMRTAAPARAPSDAYVRIATLRRQAVERGVVVTGVIDDSTGPRAVTALPDGSVIADAAMRVDRRTGRRLDAAR